MHYLGIDSAIWNLKLGTLLRMCWDLAETLVLLSLALATALQAYSLSDACNVSAFDPQTAIPDDTLSSPHL